MKIIGAATGLGAQDPASGQGPDFLFQNTPEYSSYWKSIIHTNQKELNNNISVEDKVQFLLPFFNNLSNEVKDVLKSDFPIVIGGDHSCAIGSWRGLLETSSKDVGLMWLDAHLDAHTFHTTPSKAIHGMPLACLLGYGSNDFLPNKILLPENVVVFGARSYEAGEKELLDFLGVRIYETNEINKRGLKKCFDEALSIISKESLDFGISLDLDMFEPNIISGVCSKERDGLNPIEFIDVFQQAKVEAYDNFKMLEIVEFAPSQDKNEETYKLIKKFIDIFLNKM